MHRALHISSPVTRVGSARRWSGAVGLLLGAAGLSGCAAAASPPAGIPADVQSASELQTNSRPAWYREAEIRELAPGVIHRSARISDGPWAVHVVEVDLRRCGVGLRTVKGRDSMIGRESTSGIFARTTGAPGHAVAAVNADFFRYEPDGVPEGPQVADGIVVAAAGSYGPSVSTRYGIPQPVFGVTRSGRVFVGEAAIAGQAWSAAGNLPLARVNALPGPDSLALFNHFVGDLPPHGTSTVHASIRRIAPAGGAGDVQHGVVLAIDSLHAPTAKDAGEVALAGTGAAADWVRGLATGDTVRWHLAFSGAPGALAELVGGFPLLILDGESVLHRVPRIWPPFATGRHPRTAVAIDGDGTVLLLVVDGRQEGYSVGMTLEELTDLLLELGAVDALNLDGGGSTTLVTTEGIVNRPSDAEERPVANVLLAVGEGGC